MKRKIIQISLIVLLAYATPIATLYLFAMSTGLPGRRGGPQDAFRHTYSCALVTRYLSPRVVDLVTTVFERDDNSPHDLMDRHNNRIGKMIGLSSENLYDAVSRRVSLGEINTSHEDTITWLTEDLWTNGF